MRGFFEDVTQTPHPTRSGTCSLPILYRDASQFGVFFLVDPDRAREVVGADKTIEPWTVMGRAIAAIYVWEYRDSSVGAYGEVGLGIQCRQVGSSPSLLRLARDMGAQDEQGIWVANLPVTTDVAREAGIDLWGFPKYVTPIETRFSEEGASGKLGSELVLSLDRLRGPILVGQPVVTYTGKEGRLIRTCIDVDHEVRWGSGMGARLELTGDGPTAETARRLGLDEARMVAAFRTDGFRAKLPAGKDLGPLKR